MANNLSLTLIILVLSLVCLFFLFREWYRREKQLENLKDRVRKLEETNVLRVPQKSQDHMLDAIAMQNARIERLKVELEYEENIQAHMTNALSVGTKREKGKQS